MNASQRLRSQHWATYVGVNADLALKGRSTRRFGCTSPSRVDENRPSVATTDHIP